MPLPNDFLVYGSEETLKPLILQLLAQHYALQDLNVDAQGGSTQRVLPHYVKGKIYIKIYFNGIIRGTAANHKVEKAFRLMNDDPATISLERIKNLGNLVHAKFNNFTFVTGKEAYTYNSPEHGFNRCWGYYLDVANAKKVLEQLLDLVPVSPDWRRLSRSTVVEPGDRFQEPPEKVIQAGVSIRQSRERPIADMKFRKASIKFPHISKEFDLVNEFGLTINSLDFLLKYDNNE